MSLGVECQNTTKTQMVQRKVCSENFNSTHLGQLLLITYRVCLQEHLIKHTQHTYMDLYPHPLKLSFNTLLYLHVSNLVHSS